MKYLILSIFFLSATCNAVVFQQIENSDISQCWRYSYEDDTEEYRAYRLCTYDFPPSRGRESMTFAKDGTFSYQAIGAADGVDELRGTWQLNGDELVMAFYENIRETKRYKVVGVSASMLKLRTLKK